MSFMEWKKSKGENLEEHSNGYFINYISEPPNLQHIASVSIAVRLWSEPDIIDGLRQHPTQHYIHPIMAAAGEIYEEYEKKVLQKFDVMLLPKKVKCKISEKFFPIALQLFKSFVKEFEDQVFVNGECFLNVDKGYCRFYDIFRMGGALHWTMEGIIDNVASLKELINNEDQEKDFYGLYELACKYCLEEYIPYIWKKISPKKKREHDDIYKKYDYHIVAYWTAYIKEKLSCVFEKLKKTDVDNIYDNNLSIEQNMISLSIFVKNSYSLKYFWNKLKEHERNVCLEKWLNLALHKYSEWGEYEYQYQECKDKTRILCFLLSQLNDKNQQKKIFQDHSKIILKALFHDWPWQRFFLPTFFIILDSVSEEVFVCMMLDIVDKIREGNEIIKDVFKEIWLKSSLKLKKSFIQYFIEYTSSDLCRFIDVDDVEAIFMILKHATEKESKQIIFNMIESNGLFSSLLSNKLSLIDNIMTKYLSTKEDIDQFKDRVMSVYDNYLCKNWIPENDFLAIEKLFNWGLKSPKEVQEFKEKKLEKNDIYISLVCLGDYELIDRFLKWCFESEDDIHEFKKSFILKEIEGDSLLYSDLLWELSNHSQGWESFEKFVSFTFFSPEETTQFKNMFLRKKATFFTFYRFEFAHKFVTWCLDSVDELNQFKNSFLTSEEGRKFLLCAVHESYPDFYQPNEIIKWFSISKKSTAKLKRKLNNIKLFKDYGDESEAEYKRWALFYMLDKHAGSHSAEYKEDTINTGKVSDITTEIRKAFKHRKKMLMPFQRKY